jgi:hypothetical protein
MNNLLAPVLIGSASTLLLLVFVCGVNLALRYIRLQPWSEADAQFVHWCAWCGLAYVILSGLR